jgi:DNA-3-methyladenine glycosylase I
MTEKKIARCAWLNPEHEEYRLYHDEVWGMPVHDDRVLFEMLILEGAQAGLSWETILKRRDNYRKAFFGFDVKRCAAMTDADVNRLLGDEGIIRNRLKIASVKTNALAFIGVQKEFGSFDAYLWSRAGGRQIDPKYKTIRDIPVTGELSDALAKELKARGMKFFGSTIVQAYLQAVGVINAHTTDCYRYKVIKAVAKGAAT